MHLLSDYDFFLPEHLIAQYPSQKRDESKLLIYNKASAKISDSIFSNIVNLINPNDVLVINNTRVIPARLKTVRVKTGAAVEFLLLKRINSYTWEALVNPAKKAPLNEIFDFNGLSFSVAEIIENSGSRIIQFDSKKNVDEHIQTYGKEPLPPYIKRDTEINDKERYQTVYADKDGAAAAPTAGLHFTNEILEQLKLKGVKIVPITLHVGLGTFRPVKVEHINEHHMHAEYFEISSESAKIINTAKKNNLGRIIAVGTTSSRALESACLNGEITAGAAETSIFIYPGYQFKIVDALITNFHTPLSSLLMLVSAFAGYEEIKKIYAHAISQKYRFFSYGDAMLIE